MKGNFRKPLGLVILSALILGISQPLLMPALFGSEPAPEWLGLLCLCGYVPLLQVIKNRTLKETFLYSFLMVTLQYTIVLFWIYIALHVYGHISPLPASIITLLLPMKLALMVAVFFSIGRFLSIHFKRSFLWFMPAALCSAEYFRNYYLFGGFPWGHEGYSIARIPEFLQLASLVGIYGLVFFVGLSNALVAGIYNEKGRSRRIMTLALGGLLIGAFSFGFFRLKTSEHEFAPSVRVALLQGNIPQEIKSSARLFSEDIIDIYSELHEKAIKEEAQLIVWPESAYPMLVNQDRPDLELKHRAVANVIGVTTYKVDENNKFSYYQNSALLSDYQGQIVGRYDKSHLVPFGEYVPWPMVNIVDKVVPGMGAFRPGREFVPVQVPIGLGKNIAVGTTICYEGIFPEIGRAYAKNGASLLVNITNDAWYGVSSAPLQHLLMYQLRAVESGRPYVRATNSGVSAWVDAYGRIKDRLGLFERGLIIADVPMVMVSTLYVLIGDSVPILSLLFLCLSFIWAAVPFHSMWRKRNYRDLGLVAFFLSIALSSYFYFSGLAFVGDEAARTKNLGIMVLSLVVMVGSITKSPRSRAVLLCVATFVVFMSVLLALFESLYFLSGLIVGVLIYLLAFRMTLKGKSLQ